MLIMPSEKHIKRSEPSIRTFDLTVADGTSIFEFPLRACFPVRKHPEMPNDYDLMQGTEI
jgi:hypothetical protein